MLLTSPLSSPLKNPVRDVFSPAGSSQSLTAQAQALFAGGKVGGMWDMGDTSTLWRNPLFGGVNPVTTAGQTIGVVADVSRQSGFTDVSGHTWTVASGDGVLSVVGNQVTITGATTATRVDRTGGNIAAETRGLCKMVITANWASATGPLVWCCGNPTAPVNGVALTVGNQIESSSLHGFQITSGTATFTVDEFKMWPGSTATQSTAIKRPLYQVVSSYGCAQFDAVNDALLFPAITFGGAFNTFVASKVTGGTLGLHLWRTADSGGGFWGAYESGSGTIMHGAAVGTPSYSVNGVAVSPATRGQLYSQVNGVDSVLESTGIVLSAETALQFSGYPSGQFQGNANRVLMISGTLTAGEKLLCRQWAAEGNGATVV